MHIKARLCLLLWTKAQLQAETKMVTPMVVNWSVNMMGLGSPHGWNAIMSYMMNFGWSMQQDH
jgi:hypothetical protein